MSTSRRSIIKSNERRSVSRRSDTKKRLSFAPSPPSQKKKMTEEQNSDISQFGNESVITDLSGKLTVLGMCYDRKANVIAEDEQHETAPMNESQRNPFPSVLNFSSPSGTTANVLIVGERSFGEKLKEYILDMHQKQLTMQNLNRRMDLNITCEKTFTPAMTRKMHFIFYLFMMDTHESMMDLSKILRGYSEDTLPSKRIMLITVFSGHGYFKNVVDLDQFHMLLNSYHLLHIPWKEQGRFQETEVKRILELIYKSVRYHKSSSALLDYAAHIDII